ncbi:hypothetical protein OUZ56_009795 [Daphnia magna]|uniref:Uncharacterized protein n=1 Tax=Daphnia magna TaxID=35525 RepID=A0ABR0AHC0_9CRUS|nr:hypothetical protein OUZ56_009795 [Daphnia magna]
MKVNNKQEKSEILKILKMQQRQINAIAKGSVDDVAESSAVMRGKPYGIVRAALVMVLKAIKSIPAVQFSTTFEINAIVTKWLSKALERKMDKGVCSSNVDLLNLVNLFFEIKPYGCLRDLSTKVPSVFQMLENPKQYKMADC